MYVSACLPLDTCPDTVNELHQELSTLNIMYNPEADPGGVQGFNPPPPKDCPAESEIGRKGVADRL